MNSLYEALPYPEQVAYRKGAFASLLSLRSAIGNLKNGFNKSLLTKKAYTLAESYIGEAIDNLDEFLSYQGVPYGIISKEGKFKRVSEDEAKQFMQSNREKNRSK